MKSEHSQSKPNSLPRLSQSKRFFFHYNKVKKCLTVHYDNKCYLTEDITCHTACESHHQTQQPHIIMRGWTTEIIHTPTHTIIK